MTNLFISDTHFNHHNIIEYENRPFRSVEHMDREIIRRWNTVVKPKDTVIHGGDFMFGGSHRKGNKKEPEYYLDQLNGNIIVIKGNHDNSDGFRTNIESINIKLGGINWWCQHKPEGLTWKYNLCGHVHGNWEVKTIGRSVIVNLSVEVWDYYPIDISKILERLSGHEIKYILP